MWLYLNFGQQHTQIYGVKFWTTGFKLKNWTSYPTFRSSHKASALRAAHFALWLSCIESLKRKFRELAGRDSSAGRILGEIAALDEEKRSIDSYLLEQARAYGFLSSIELTKLVHIYTMDNIYRCPYEKSPKIEEFIANASVVVDSVLCRPTRLQTSSASERAHLLAQEVLSLSRIFEKQLQQQKQATQQQQPLSQPIATPGKPETPKHTGASQSFKPSSPATSQTPLTNKPESCSQLKPDLQKAPQSTKAELSKKPED